MRDVSNAEAMTYATSKLDAAGVLSASFLQDMCAPHNLGFIGTAYTAAHGSMELLLAGVPQKGAD